MQVIVLLLMRFFALAFAFLQAHLIKKNKIFNLKTK
jgi:hypothetical protein